MQVGMVSCKDKESDQAVHALEPNAGRPVMVEAGKGYTGQNDSPAEGHLKFPLSVRASISHKETPETSLGRMDPKGTKMCNREEGAEH